MANENEYTGLIAGAHKDKERFTEWVYQLTEPVLEAREGLLAFVKDYDVDLAEDTCLDAVGVRVGAARKIKARIDDVFYARDDVDGKGFDIGIWKTPKDDSYGINSLADEQFRGFIKTKIALNHYGGTNEEVLVMLDKIREAFGLTYGQIFYVDNQDMSIEFCLSKKRNASILLALFENDVIPFNNAGVLQNISETVPMYLATTTGVLLETGDGTQLVMDT